MRSCFLMMFLVTVLPAKPSAAEPPGCEAQNVGPTHSVAQVLDGETLLLHDGSQVRLVGILAPRAGDVGAKPGAWPSEIAARAELEAMALGKAVLLSGTANQQDRYGRHVAHAFVEEAGNRVWLQAQLVRQGLARVHPEPTEDACTDALLKHEAQARQDRRGLWTEAAYELRRADAPDALVPLRGTFQVIEGRIGKLTRSRSDLRLELGDAKRRFALRIRVPAAASRKAGQEQGQVKEGTAVRVRGWLEERADGPLMDLAFGGGLEVLQTDPAR